MVCRSNQLWIAFVLVWCLALCLAQGETGYIQILADPGMSVFMDGGLVGTTNQKAEGLVIANVLPGRHTLLLQKKGFKPYKTTLAVAPRRVTVYTLESTLPAITIDEEDSGRTGYMEPRTGILELSCLPVHCRVSIPRLELDDYPKKSSRLKISNVLATSYRLEISIGNKQIKETVEVEPDATLSLVADFTGNRPELQIAVIQHAIRNVPIPQVTALTRPIFAVVQKQPLDVLLVNEGDKPPTGLVAASAVFEMPIEAGSTALMAVYTSAVPAKVGPLARAKDYFLEAALRMNGILVHNGGAPSTLSRIESQGLTTINAGTQGYLGSSEQGDTPFYAKGRVLRSKAGNLKTAVSGVIYKLPERAQQVSKVNVTYSADYQSGFRYLSDLGGYRWVRNGTAATGPEGTAITAHAVVVARITAFPYPNDSFGRLYLPYSGGEARLFIGGKTVAGSWTPEGGFSFVTKAGQKVDLTPFKHWILFVPEEVSVKVQ